MAKIIIKMNLFVNNMAYPFKIAFTMHEVSLEIVQLSSLSFNYSTIKILIV